MTCHFAEGSQALGCHIKLSFLNDSQTFNISREGKSLTLCDILPVNTTCYPSDSYQSQVYVFDWEADGTMGTLPVPVELVLSEKASDVCGRAPGTATPGHINPGV